MIKLVSLFGNELNLNGDQGNLLVLEKRLSVMKQSFTTTNFEPGDDLAVLNNASFLLIGHGSAAAWRYLQPELERVSGCIKALIAGGTLTLAVASGAEKLYEETLGLFDEELREIERVSRFEVCSFDDFEVLGYRNSNKNLPVFEGKNNLFMTSLHGPLLAKNPQLADLFLAKLGLDSNGYETELKKLDRFVSEVWKLEKPLAGK